MFEQVRDIISTVCQIDPDSITKDTQLISDLGLNSFELINLIIAFEEKLNIEVDDDELPDFHTVGDIVLYLEEHV